MMRARQWTVLLAAGGCLLGLGSCAADVAYYALTAAVDYLPDLLEAWTGSSTT